MSDPFEVYVGPYLQTQKPFKASEFNKIVKSITQWDDDVKGFTILLPKCKLRGVVRDTLLEWCHAGLFQHISAGDMEFELQSLKYLCNDIVQSLNDKDIPFKWQWGFVVNKV